MADETGGEIVVGSKSGLGLVHDLDRQSQSVMLALGNWNAEYRKLLLECHKYWGTNPYTTIDGENYINSFLLDSAPLTEGNPANDLMKHLGWTDADFEEYNYMIMSDGVEHTFYRFAPQTEYTDATFDIMIQNISAVFPDLHSMRIETKIKSYLDSVEEEGRVGISIKDLNYGGYKANIWTKNDGENEPRNWIGGTIPTDEFNHGINNISLLNEAGEIIDVWTVEERKTRNLLSDFLHNSLYSDYITSTDLEKIGEEEVKIVNEHGTVIGHMAIMSETLRINTDFLDFYDYGEDGMEEEDLIFKTSGGDRFKPLYIVSVWLYIRESGKESSINQKLGMYKQPSGSSQYCLREDFEQCGHTNATTYLTFSAIEIDVEMKEEKSRGFFRGLIRVVFRVVLAWFSWGSTEYIWYAIRVVTLAISVATTVDKKKQQDRQIASMKRNAENVQRLRDKEEDTEDTEYKKYSVGYENIYDTDEQYNIFDEQYNRTDIFGYKGVYSLQG